MLKIPKCRLDWNLQMAFDQCFWTPQKSNSVIIWTASALQKDFSQDLHWRWCTSIKCYASSDKRRHGNNTPRVSQYPDGFSWPAKKNNYKIITRLSAQTLLLSSHSTHYRLSMNLCLCNFLSRITNQAIYRTCSISQTPNLISATITLKQFEFVLWEFSVGTSYIWWHVLLANGRR